MVLANAVRQKIKSIVKKWLVFKEKRSTTTCLRLKRIWYIANFKLAQRANCDPAALPFFLFYIDLHPHAKMFLALHQRRCQKPHDASLEKCVWIFMSSQKKKKQNSTTERYRINFCGKLRSTISFETALGVHGMSLASRLNLYRTLWIGTAALSK